MTATHHFTVTTRSNPEGDDVGAESASIHPSGALYFVNNGRIDIAYAPGEWKTFEYSYPETDS